MSARDDILASIRANRPGGAHDLPPVPLFEEHAPADRVAEFRRRVEQMGGRALDPGPEGDPAAPVRGRLAGAAVVCSTVPEIPGNRDIRRVARPADLADVDVAVARAAFGVAETGSVLFTEAELGVNALAYLAQHLVVLLDPADIVPNMHAAYQRPEFRAARYAAFHTGPSATADIEGVLIHGAQGVRSLTVLLLPQRP